MEPWAKQVKSWNALARRAEYSAPKLARICGISLRHLQRHFHDIFGIEVRPWLKYLRLQDASHLLGAYSIKEVSFLLSFKQSNHFSREFKKHFGINPQDYQRRQKLHNPQVVAEVLHVREEMTPKAPL